MSAEHDAETVFVPGPRAVYEHATTQVRWVAGGMSPPQPIPPEGQAWMMLSSHATPVPDGSTWLLFVWRRLLGHRVPAGQVQGEARKTRRSKQDREAEEARRREDERREREAEQQRWLEYVERCQHQVTTDQPEVERQREYLESLGRNHYGHRDWFVKAEADSGARYHRSGLVVVVRFRYGRGKEAHAVIGTETKVQGHHVVAQCEVLTKAEETIARRALASARGKSGNFKNDQPMSVNDNAPVRTTAHGLEP